MNQIASQSQLRLAFMRWALVTIPAIEFLGFLSGFVSNSGSGNQWYAGLDKPALMPPGSVFATVWPLLYLLLAVAIAIILHARGARGRGIAIILFLIQLACNLAWSPLFFGAHEAELAFYLLLVTFVLATITTVFFGRIRRLAAWLMLPYLAWLGFASGLAYDVYRMNPGAERLVPAAVRTQI